MLIKDSVVTPRLEYGTQREKKFDQMKKWVEEQTAHAFYVKDDDLSPANAQRQLGKQMWPVELEARLKKLNPNLHFEVNQFNPSMKALFHVRPGEGKVFVCAYHNSIMPEHSIVRVKEELVQDFNFVRGDLPHFHLDRKDMPKVDRNEDGSVEWGEQIPLGFKKVLIPWGEFRRGWRTVAIKIVEARLATPQQVENVFGTDDRPEWASHMGKKSLILPW